MLFTTGDGRSVSVDDIARTYRKIASLSTPASGKIARLDASGDKSDGDEFGLTCNFSAKDCDTLEFVKTSKFYSLRATSKGIQSVKCVTHHQTISEVASAVSENGRFLAKLRCPNKDDKQLLEIWDHSQLVKTIDITKIDAHGPINTDPVFTSFRWSPYEDQDKLLYVAQAKRPKYQTFFEQAAAASETSESSSKKTNLGDDHERLEDWGECLKGIEHTVVAILDVANGCEITTLDMKGFSLADSRWLQGSKVVSTAYEEGCRRLGLVYCNNRPSRLVIHDWRDDSVHEVKEEQLCLASPRVSHSGTKFVYLIAPLYGPHKHSSKIRLYDLDTQESEGLEDSVSEQVDHFIMAMPDNCFSSDDSHIMFVENDHLHHHLCLFNLKNSTLKKVKFPMASVELLDFRYDIILASGADVNSSPALFAATLDTQDANGKPVAPWHQIEAGVKFDDVAYEKHEIELAGGDKNQFISSLLVRPTMGDDLPTVVLAHGGPHSTVLVDYIPKLLMYARCGLRTLLINYRGSTGVSEEYLHSLCGNVGTLDVNDCLTALRYFDEKELINRNKLVIEGGSHGGFIAGHLSCQEEFKFTSAILRNPVIDLSSMHAISDIPDWVFTEGLNELAWDSRRTVRGEELERLFKCSPISKLHLANAPTLMLLGTQDRRVPCAQGERWFELLKARGVETKCKVYADKHDLGKVESSCDGDISAIMWILRHL